MGKYLDKSGVSQLWEATKGKISKEIKENVTDKLGVANGIATLDSQGKLSSDSLPALKTINGESVIGSGNIAIDLNVYQIVESLPESNQNPNKIYLVLTSPATGQAQDIYTEYAWINNKWEKFGEYKAEVDLSGYLKKEDIEEEVKDAGFVTFDDVVSSTKNGLVTPDQKKGIDAVESTGFIQLNALIHTPEDVQISTTQYKDGSVTGGKMFKFKGADSTDAGAMSSAHFTKLEAIEAQATKDEAITSEELDAILV